MWSKWAEIAVCRLLRWRMLPLLIIIHHLVQIIHSKCKGAHNSVSHHRNNNTPLRRFDQTRPAMWPTLFLPGMQSNSTRERIPGKKKKKSESKAAPGKKRKIPTKACIFPAWAHCTFLIAQTHISCIKTTARRINLPERDRVGAETRVIWSRIIVGLVK